MTAVSLSGRELASVSRAGTAERVEALRTGGIQPLLAVVSATADEATGAYVRAIASAAAKVGIAVRIVELTPQSSAASLAETLRGLSGDPAVHGIILQTPLPPNAVVAELASLIDPEKDVDGANPTSLGRIAAGLPAFAPATAEAVLALLDHHGVELTGRHAVVVGRSMSVGKPTLHLLLDRHATVTVCHSRTRNLAAFTSQADVLVVAAGRPGLITADHVRPGAVVIDVGTNVAADGGLVGDVDSSSVTEVAAALTPVPGGVGPVTTALLLRHTAAAAHRAPEASE